MDGSAKVEGPALTTSLPVKPLNVRGLEIAPVAGDGAVGFEMVDPAALLVDPVYQRGLSQRSVVMIRRIVEGFDWRRFKPPIVARTAAGLEVIDGQHTAIAAASHPAITEIPVFVIAAATQADRAAAFIGHNRDRLNVTATQLHHSAIAAGDPHAAAINAVCQEAGVNLVATQAASGQWRPRDTMAVGAIGVLVRRKDGPARAVKVLRVLAEAELAPISAGHIKAVDMLLHDDEYADAIDGPAISEVLKYAAELVDQEATLFAATHGVRHWKALGIKIFHKARKGRRGHG